MTIEAQAAAGARRPAHPARHGRRRRGRLHRRRAPHRRAARRPVRAGGRRARVERREGASAPALALGLADDRCYADYAAMAKAEAARADGIEAVAIVTPNHLHAPVAEAFLKAGIHVICDKPLATTRAARRAACEALAAKHGRAVRGHLQLHRLPDGARGAAAGAGRPARRDPRGPGRVRAGLADRVARGHRPEAGRVAHRPGALGRGRLHRRHRHACVPARRLRRRARGQRALRRAQHLRRRPAPRRQRPGAAALRQRRARRALGEPGRARQREQPAPARLRQPRRARVAPGAAEPARSGRRSASRRRRSRAPPAPPVPRRRGCRAFRPAIPRAISRRSPRSTARSPRRSAPRARARAKADPAVQFPGLDDGRRGVEFIEAAVASSARGGRWVRLGR